MTASKKKLTKTKSKKKTTKTKSNKKTATKKAKVIRVKTVTVTKAAIKKVAATATPNAVRSFLRTAAELDKENTVLNKRITLLEECMHSAIDEVEDLRETVMTLMSDLVKNDLIKTPAASHAQKDEFELI